MRLRLAGDDLRGVVLLGLLTLVMRLWLAGNDLGSVVLLGLLALVVRLAVLQDWKCQGGSGNGDQRSLLM
jgi:hypothetical protein